MLPDYSLYAQRKTSRWQLISFLFLCATFIEISHGESGGRVIFHLGANTEQHQVRLPYTSAQPVGLKPCPSSGTSYGKRFVHCGTRHCPKWVLWSNNSANYCHRKARCQKKKQSSRNRQRNRLLPVPLANRIRKRSCFLFYDFYCSVRFFSTKRRNLHGLLSIYCIASVPVIDTLMLSGYIYIDRISI